ncbi:MAG TPA: metallophosphoesterase [Chloroflexota bacterium]|nr:metallophosphoesterase [Chloroflexota bacterium]
MSVTLAHSSDVHLNTDLHDDYLQLRRVLAGAAEAKADLLMLAGDTFEHVRFPVSFFREAGQLLATATHRVVILPGNHDPLFEASEDRWRAMAEPDNVHVLGLDGDEPVRFPDLDLEIWGWAHRSYGGMDPLRQPPPKGARWQVAMAHGHFTDKHYSAGEPSPSWLIFAEDIDALSSDYLALGHWNCAVQVGTGAIPAHYSGSPDLEHTINIITLSDDGIQVTRHPLPEPQLKHGVA